MLKQIKTTTLVPVGFAARRCDECEGVRPFQIRRERVQTGVSIGGFVAMNGKVMEAVDVIECWFCGSTSRVTPIEVEVNDWQHGVVLGAELDVVTADDVRRLIAIAARRGFLVEEFTLAGFWTGGLVGLLLAAWLTMSVIPTFDLSPVTSRGLALLAFSTAVVAGGLVTGLRGARHRLLARRCTFLATKILSFRLQPFLHELAPEWVAGSRAAQVVAGALSRLV